MNAAGMFSLLSALIKLCVHCVEITTNYKIIKIKNIWQSNITSVKMID